MTSFFSLILLSSLFSQTLSEKYDWEFQKMDMFGWDWGNSSIRTVPLRDTICLFQGMHPVVFVYRGKLSPGNMGFILSRIMILPKSLKGDSCRVRFEYKMHHGKDFYLQAVALSDQGKQLHADSIRLDGGDWNTATLSIPRSQARAIRISMEYKGTTDSLQRVWVNRIGIDIDGRDIAGYPCEASSPQDSARIVKSFKKKYAVPLSETEDDGLLTKIPSLADKKIIGMGEFAHGSYSIMQAQLQWCKNLINSNRCKLLLLEYPQNRSLLFNLYVQGCISEEYVGNIEEDLRVGMLDYELFLDFFEWLKKYNQTAQEKVFLIGIDEDLSSYYKNLYPVFEALLGKEKCIPYLDLLQEQNYRGAVCRLEKDSCLIKRIGKKSVDYLASVLGEREKNRFLSDDARIDRDSLMADRTEKTIGMLLDSAKIGVIVAHSEHISKLPYLNMLPSKVTLGQLLEKKYGNDYFAISFQAGEGTLLDEKGIIGMLVHKVNLPPPPYNSFENVALSSGIDYFYYPTRYLHKDIIQLCSLKRPNMGKDYYGFSPIKAKYDALVFMRVSTPHKNVGFNVRDATKE